MDFSVLMSVYKNTKVSELDECLQSLYNQTVKASEIVIVIDGQIDADLQQYLDECALRGDVKLCPIAQNVGLGKALSFGLDNCSNEIVARMDTDDVCLLDRFEKQLRFLAENDDVSIVGCNIDEFIDVTDNVVSTRRVPQSHDDICAYLKKRCPFNHMTVVFKKSEVEKAGGYLPWHYDEDSYLWVRMYLAGCKFANIDESLVYTRINYDTFKRRGGYAYYKSERDLFKYMRKNKVIGWFTYITQVVIRLILYVLMPNKLRAWAFKKFARK